MNINKLIFNNFGLKIIAFLLAIFVWIVVVGKERSYLERSYEINVEYFNISNNIDVRSVRPEKVRIKVKGTTKSMKNLEPEDFKIRIDLKRVSQSTLGSFFTEDYLEYPDQVEILSIHPKMIEMVIWELMSKEVPVRIVYKGKLPSEVKLIERKLIPEKIRIFGYKSQIENINTVFCEKDVNLAEITETKRIKIRLKKRKEILKFENEEEIEVLIVVENRYGDSKKG